MKIDMIEYCREETKTGKKVTFRLTLGVITFLGVFLLLAKFGILDTDLVVALYKAIR